MPRRSTPKQEAIYLLRKALRPEGWTVTESEFMHDSVLDMPREVDVVARGTINDIEVVLCFEVVSSSRRADVIWVEAMLAKHEHLETNKLILVSWRGFTDGAHRLAKANPSVSLIQPKQHASGAQFYLRIEIRSITLEVFDLDLLTDANERISRRVDRQALVYDANNKLLGTIADLFEGRASDDTPLVEHLDWDDLWNRSGAVTASCEEFTKPIYLADHDRPVLILGGKAFGLFNAYFSEITSEMMQFGDLVFGLGTVSSPPHKGQLVSAVLGSGTIRWAVSDKVPSFRSILEDERVD